MPINFLLHCEQMCAFIYNFFPKTNSHKLIARTIPISLIDGFYKHRTDVAFTTVPPSRTDFWPEKFRTYGAPSQDRVYTWCTLYLTRSTTNLCITTSYVWTQTRMVTIRTCTVILYLSVHNEFVYVEFGRIYTCSYKRGKIMPQWSWLTMYMDGPFVVLWVWLSMTLSLIVLNPTLWHGPTDLISLKDSDEPRLAVFLHSHFIANK